MIDVVYKKSILMFEINILKNYVFIDDHDHITMMIMKEEN
jgi:hypothetical protein